MHYQARASHWPCKLIRSQMKECQMYWFSQTRPRSKCLSFTMSSRANSIGPNRDCWCRFLSEFGHMRHMYSLVLTFPSPPSHISNKIKPTGDSERNLSHAATPRNDFVCIYVQHHKVHTYLVGNWTTTSWKRPRNPFRVTFFVSTAWNGDAVPMPKGMPNRPLQVRT